MAENLLKRSIAAVTLGRDCVVEERGCSFPAGAVLSTRSDALICRGDGVDELLRKRERERQEFTQNCSTTVVTNELT